MLTFDDFVIGMEQFGTRILPLMTSRQGDSPGRLDRRAFSNRLESVGHGKENHDQDEPQGPVDQPPARRIATAAPAGRRGARPASRPVPAR